MSAVSKATSSKRARPSSSKKSKKSTGAKKRKTTPKKSKKSKKPKVPKRDPTERTFTLTASNEGTLRFLKSLRFAVQSKKGKMTKSQAREVFNKHPLSKIGRLGMTGAYAGIKGSAAAKDFQARTKKMLKEGKGRDAKIKGFKIKVQSALKPLSTPTPVVIKVKKDDELANKVLRSVSAALRSKSTTKPIADVESRLRGAKTDARFAKIVRDHINSKSGKGALSATYLKGRKKMYAPPRSVNEPAIFTAGAWELDGPALKGMPFADRSKAISRKYKSLKASRPAELKKYLDAGKRRIARKKRA